MARLSQSLNVFKWFIKIPFFYLIQDNFNLRFLLELSCGFKQQWQKIVRIKNSFPEFNPCTLSSFIRQRFKWGILVNREWYSVNVTRQFVNSPIHGNLRISKFVQISFAKFVHISFAKFVYISFAKFVHISFA